ncbi:hypothetical protein B0T10DRAFT_484569 [Thelonectria olida]|uniref:Uncharacterized protein n=1 Tax=Thelonectria olida TaxID=1576542 RepID=A0A9P9AN06_9HYPO|nr:hypothetical protein B0T10DRAFT_484569 [Thelonectria olida]
MMCRGDEGGDGDGGGGGGGFRMPTDENDEWYCLREASPPEILPVGAHSRPLPSNGILFCHFHCHFHCHCRRLLHGIAAARFGSGLTLVALRIGCRRPYATTVHQLASVIANLVSRLLGWPTNDLTAKEGRDFLAEAEAGLGWLHHFERQQASGSLLDQRRRLMGSQRRRSPLFFFRPGPWPELGPSLGWLWGGPWIFAAFFGNGLDEDAW